MTDNFDAQMDKVAKHVADKAVQPTTTFTECLDAFKQLTLYYGLLLKNKSPPEDEQDTAHFDNFSRRFDQENENGRPGKKVSGRRGDA